MEDQILCNEWNNHTAAELGARLGRTTQAINVRAHILGLKKDHYGRVWTPQRLKILKDHYANMFNKPLAAWVGVSVRSLIRKARELGLEKRAGFLDDRRKDIQTLAKEGMKRSNKIVKTRFKKGVRNNPSGEFKPGHVESQETKARRSAALKHAWKVRKAKMDLDMNLHPEKYYTNLPS